MNIHIALVGGSLVPVYQGLLKSKGLFNSDPDLVIFLHSQKTKGDAKYLENFYKEYESNINFEYIELPDNDITAANNIIDTLSNRQELKSTDNGITIDITGGLKPWVVLLYRHFLSRAEENINSVFIFYTDQTAGTTDMITLQNFKNYIADLSIEQILRLNGRCKKEDLQTGNDFQDYTEADLQVIEIIEDLFNKHPEGMQELARFARLNQDYAVPADTSKRVFKLSSYQEDTLQVVKILIAKNKNDSSPQTFILKSEHALDLLHNNHWFEVLLGQIIQNWPRSNLQNTEMKLGTKIIENKIFQAEFDVILNIQNEQVSRLLVTEGKSGKNDLNTIRQRAASIKRYAGTNAIGIFATYKNIGSEKEKTCRKSNLVPFCLRDETNLHQPLQDAIKSKSTILYKELDNLILKNNK